MRPLLTVRSLIGPLTWLAAMALPAVADASGDRYRLELIVFRNVGVAATPVSIEAPRRFGNAFELDESAMPEDPVRVDKRDGTFANIWNRLDRLADYEPLLRLTFEQTAFDFHPPVRVHGEEVLAETFVIDAWNATEEPDAEASRTEALSGESEESGEPEDDTEPVPVAQFFRLDGTVQLRRSRFLHVDMDLEYRLDGPAWQREFGLPPGFEWIGGTPAEARAPRPEPGSPAPIDARQPMTETAPVNAMGLEQAEPKPPLEPFQVHRLQQSRQVRTDTLQYFDSAYFSAIVRVTEIADVASSSLTGSQVTAQPLAQ